MKSDKKQKKLTKKIEKPACIFVEGKLDYIVIDLMLRDICPEKLREKIQVFKLCSNKGLKTVKKLPGFKELKAVLVILDKDEDYKRTSQQIDSFFEKLPDQCRCRLKFISPPEDLPGKEIEDYIVDLIIQSEDSKFIKRIKDDIFHLIDDGFTQDKKVGKKVLFTYLLLKDSCSYDGLSINSAQFQSCIKVSLTELKELKSTLEKFIDFVQNKFEGE